MTIEDFLRLLLRNALLLIILTVVGFGAGYGYSYTKTPVYEATALGYVATSVTTDEAGNVVPTGANAPAGGEDSKYGTAQTFLPLFNTRAVGQSIVDQLGLDLSPDGVASGLTASIDPNAPIITVKARATTPQAAMDIANASISAVDREGAFLQTGDRDSEAAPMKLIQYQTADGGGVPVAPDRMQFGAIGAGAGLLLALAIAWLRNRNDSRVRTVEDVRSKTPVSALGVLPDSKDFGRKKDGLLPEPNLFHSKEALRKLRTNLRFANVDNPPRSIVVSSSAPGEGKSTVSGNLARVIAKSGQPVVLVDADLRRPVVAKEFGLDGSVGLSQLIAGAVTADDVVQESATKNLLILPAGQIPPNPSELLGSQRMRDIIHDLAEEYFVIVDAPPILAVTDAVLLSRHTDGAILVAVPGRTRVEGLSRAIESIRHVQGTVLGVVMNRASTSRLNRLAYGDAEYGYSSYGYSAYRTTYDSETGKRLKRKQRKNALDIEGASAAGAGDQVIRPAVDGGVYGEDGRELGPRAQARRRARAAREQAANPTQGSGAQASPTQGQAQGLGTQAPGAQGSGAQGPTSASRAPASSDSREG
ncbi:MAG: polysaccharide biosynthesis tyrosine autokinase [Dermabacter sp.]|nr:polysaccharide biosynthesis tyrosine autokinase [Dermabacter sp.]